MKKKTQVNGKPMTLVETMTKIMGRKTMTVEAIVKALKKRGFKSSDSEAGIFGYVASVLGVATDPRDKGKIFVRVERGKYKVDTLEARAARRLAAHMELVDAWRWMRTLSSKSQDRVELLMHSSDQERNAVMDTLDGPEPPEPE